MDGKRSAPDQVSGAEDIWIGYLTTNVSLLNYKS